ncbi:peptidyl-prolyl isomerase cwc27 [Ceraceosorus bombacis]|uniref:Peptidyl-prolyl isomerase cwc27 n=1 Tax=Ceraceosorus bombacis TaxID=401625 RepID=A0A0P1BNN5_9BASI|nr:peptidyl-prolyl isomerase cwc27 [Ceraceosorus bombacis]
MSNIYNTEPAPSARVVMSTSAGDLDIELWAKETPLASRNFIQLAMEGYYDGTTFHRLVQGFIIQGGDASGAGDGGESIYGQPFADEPHQRLRLNRRGLLACANEGERDSNTSQFFFTLDATPELQGRHTMFGRITEQVSRETQAKRKGRLALEAMRAQYTSSTSGGGAASKKSKREMDRASKKERENEEALKRFKSGLRRASASVSGSESPERSRKGSRGRRVEEWDEEERLMKEYGSESSEGVTGGSWREHVFRAGRDQVNERVGQDDQYVTLDPRAPGALLLDPAHFSPGPPRKARERGK